ncbi:hypothetical protein M426DRAFT_176193 [Hypoxylon sp. CI-4A]|nr:hypothetical protein M426DRAFT_176193 [Hypoxylon sp. CI-4A]
MIKPGVSLLVWALWCSKTLGLDSASLSKERLDSREQNNGEFSVEIRWTATRRDEENRGREQHSEIAPLPSITAAPILSGNAFRKSQRLQNRQAGDADADDDDDDDDSDDDANPPATQGPPPGPPPIPPEVSSSISNGVSASVSSSVAGAVSAQFSTSLDELSKSSSIAVDSARIVGISIGVSSARASSPDPTPTDASTSSSQEASTTSPASPTPTATSDESSVISSIMASASSAIDAARAEASSSAQSAVDAAAASASAVMANTNNAPTQGSSLTPGQIGGIVISVAFIAALLAALATFLIMRRKAANQDSEHKLDSNTTPEPMSQGPVDPPQTPQNRLSYLPPIATAMTTDTNHRNGAAPSNGNNGFVPDMKQRPPDDEHPAMSHAARPLSGWPETEDEEDQVFPVSPLSSEGDDSMAHRDSRRLSSIGGLDGAGLTVARQQSVSREQRAHLVRVGSVNQSDRENGIVTPLAMHPIRAHTREGSNFSTLML